MPIISSFEVDNSAALAKRFASQTMGYFDNPAAAKDDVARVSIENVYRMLEMFRYDTFEDETRGGVLALGGLEVDEARPLLETSWYQPIATALEHALTTAFGNESKSDALDKLEDSLRLLTTGQQLPADTMRQAKGFFSAFEAQF